MKYKMQNSRGERDKKKKKRKSNLNYSSKDYKEDTFTNLVYLKREKRNFNEI